MRGGERSPAKSENGALNLKKKDGHAGKAALGRKREEIGGAIWKTLATGININPKIQKTAKEQPILVERRRGGTDHRRKRVNDTPPSNGVEMGKIEKGFALETQWTRSAQGK